MKEPDFSKGLIPAVIQDALTGAVLMLGYMNEDSYRITLSEGKVCFFSRSKNRLWVKGEQSGHFLFVKDIRLDCDADTLLIQAEPAGPVCHTGQANCFDDLNVQAGFLGELETVIRQRAENPKEDSYTSRLLAKGMNKVAQKVGEEAVELVIEAKDQNEELFLGEAADLLFHYLVLLKAKGHTFSDVLKVLRSRSK